MNKLLFLFVVVLVLAMPVYACDPTIESCPPPPEDQFDPADSDNYNSPDFYATVSPTDWNWQYVDWNLVDLGRADIYDVDGFYQHLPSDKYDEIDYNQIDYGKVSQPNIDQVKYFTDKGGTGYYLDAEGFIAGEHYLFTSTGISHTSGHSVTIPGPYHKSSTGVGTKFIVTKDAIIINHDEATIKKEGVEYTTQDNVIFQAADVGDPRMYFLEDKAARINGVMLQRGKFTLRDGNVYTIPGQENHIIFQNLVVASEEETQLGLLDPDMGGTNTILVGQQVKGHYIHGDENTPGRLHVSANGNGIGIAPIKRKVGETFEIFVGEKGKNGIFAADWTLGIGGTMRAGKTFKVDDTMGAFLGNKGSIEGKSKDSELHYVVDSFDKPQATLEAENYVSVKVAGSAINKNPLADEGGGALDVDVGDAGVTIDNADPGKRTQVSFDVDMRELSWKSRPEIEQFLYDNVRLTTWGADDCEGVHCNFKSYTNRDFTLTIGESNYGSDGDRTTTGLLDFHHKPGLAYVDAYEFTEAYLDTTKFDQNARSIQRQAKRRLGLLTGEDRQRAKEELIAEMVHTGSKGSRVGTSKDYVRSILAEKEVKIPRIKDDDIPTPEGVELDFNSKNDEFQPTPYIFRINAEFGDISVSSRWGEGSGKYVFDGYQGILIDHSLPVPSDEDAQFFALENDGSRVNNEFSRVMVNHHKKKFETKYPNLQVQCNTDQCIPTNNLGGYDWWRMKEEVEALEKGTNIKVSALKPQKVELHTEMVNLGTASLAEGGRIRLNEPRLGEGRTTTGHEIIHRWERENKYGQGTSTYNDLQNGVYDGIDWIAPNLEDTSGFFDSTDLESKYEAITQTDHIFDVHCLGDCSETEHVTYVEASTESYDLFVGNPAAARSFLYPNSQRYKDLAARASTKLEGSNVGGEERRFYQGLQTALQEDSQDFVHPATFHQRLLGHMLIDGPGATNCVKDYGSGMCGKAVDAYMSVVSKAHSKHEINPPDFQKRLRKAKSLKRKFAKR